MGKATKKVSKKAAAKAKPAAKKTVKKPTVKAKAKPVAKKVAKKPVAKAKPVAKKAAKKVVAKAKAKPVAKKSVKKVAPKAKAKPAPKKAVKKVVAKAKSKPVAKKAVKKPVAKVKAKPVVKIKAKPAAKVAAKPANNLLKTAPQPKGKAAVKKGMTTKYKSDPNTDHRYSDDELKEFKELIDKKLFNARDELKYLKEALENHTDSQAGNKAWNMEEGTDTSEMETLMNQISRQHAYIRNLELALVRVENKTYGICRVTGKLIPKERLRVVPHATLSLEAKMGRKTEDESAETTSPAAPADFSEGFSED